MFGIVVLVLVDPARNYSFFIVVTLCFISGYKSWFLLLVSAARVLLLLPPYIFVGIFLFNRLVGGGFLL